MSEQQSSRSNSSPFSSIVKFFSEIFRERDHFGPHSRSGFEGFYSRTQLDNGGSITIVFCWVENARDRGNLVHISYIPPNALTPIIKYDYFPDTFRISSARPSEDGIVPFVVHSPSLGTMKVTPTSVQYTIDSPQDKLFLNLTLTNRTPWSNTSILSGPMGFVARISRLLPLNWHVYSTHSDAAYDLSYGDTHINGSGVSHIEKNWGTSFPKGWIWSQSFNSGAAGGGKSLSLAGGIALPGVNAYLIGYRSPNLHWDFRPPFAMALGPISPFLKVKHFSNSGIVDITVQTFTRKLVIRIQAPVETFFSFPAPLKEGHRLGYAYESFRAKVWVECWTRKWPWSTWIKIEEGQCGVSEQGVPCAALEFGGSYCHLVE
ncbi:hypothetical protein C8Q75DRAFT_753183 [Abortiporus biennis]|nr:hypothetical protein C8Q75DRAFT_753183 [Abortiporus biennis]